MTARAKRWCRIEGRGLPPRREWVAPSFREADLLREVAAARSVSAGELIRALVIHRARARLSRAKYLARKVVT